MAGKLERAPKGYAVQQKVKRCEKSFMPSLYAVLNADLVSRQEHSGRLTLTRAGWELLGEQPPFWMNTNTDTMEKAV